MTDKKPVGRPRKYQSPDEFDTKVDEYLASCVANEEPITWTGLALHLGFCSRSEIDNYLEYDGFSHSVKRAKMIVENAYEKRLQGSNPTGAIFALKNMNWRDKIEQEISGSGFSINIDLDDKPNAN
jgi:hypothetical protein